jgi:uncharacterized protein
MSIWRAANEGDLAEVQRLVEQKPGLLDARDGVSRTPLMLASQGGAVRVVRWLLEQEAAINARNAYGQTALWLASWHRRPRTVGLLLERGADPATASGLGSTPLVAASSQGCLEVVRVLLGHASARATINRRGDNGKTALWEACYVGHGGVVRALLESGADPTTARSDGITPVAIAKKKLGEKAFYRGGLAQHRRECVVVSPSTAGSAWRRWR